MTNSATGCMDTVFFNIEIQGIPDINNVFTPNGDLVQLPVNSTPIDFAFNVHTEVGLHCIGAKVDHKVVPLNTILKNGDTIEILTSKSQNPSYGWLKFIVTSKARININRFLQ